MDPKPQPDGDPAQPLDERACGGSANEAGTPGKKERGAADKESSKRKNRFWFSRIDIKDRAELVFAFALTVSALLTNWQTLRIIKQGEEDSLEQQTRLEMEQRPWVHFSGVSLTTEFSETAQLGIICTIANVGRTPALNVRSRVVTAVDTEFPTVKNTYKKDPIKISSPVSQGVIGPNQSVQIRVDSNLSLAEFRARRPMTEKPVYFLCVGFIDYTDVFGKEHRTTVSAYRFAGDGETSREMRFAPAGNSMK